MLKPEQVAEIRIAVATNDRQQWQRHVNDLLADRAEIAQELERIRDFAKSNRDLRIEMDLTALIERLK